MKEQGIQVESKCQEQLFGASPLLRAGLGHGVRESGGRAAWERRLQPASNGVSAPGPRVDEEKKGSLRAGGAVSGVLAVEPPGEPGAAVWGEQRGAGLPGRAPPQFGGRWKPVA